MQNFSFYISPWPYIVTSEISSSFSITDLVRTNLMLCRFSMFLLSRFQGNIDYLEKCIKLNFNLYTKTGVIQIKGMLVKRQWDIENATYGPEKLYRATLKCTEFNSSGKYFQSVNYRCFRYCSNKT